ncbi:exonuclease SbcC [Pseudomonas sp. YH-1]|uniref:AAA family ATPase n=1 Tax=Pseudomonas sp. YH-1 TaxID=3384787 RepID=UPI003F7DB8AD
MKSFVSINSLTLVGHRKNYIIPFYPGVNIIYGDSDTGKSSVLEFINYLLGSSGIELADEVLSSVSYAALELELNGVQYTVKRNIFDPKDYIEVYPCIFSKCTDFFPKKYSPNFKDVSAPDGFFSDFLMDSLGFPKIKIKVSPSKIDSEVRRLGFRGLFEYSYINQDDVGSKNFLNAKDWARATQSREIFKYIFNVLDSAIAEHAALAASLKKEQADLLDKYKAVSEFLRETNHNSRESLDSSIEDIDKTISAFKVELSQMNSNMLADSERYQQIKAVFNQLSLNEKRVALELSRTHDQIERYTRLKNDYENDIAKIKSAILAKSKIGELAVVDSPCPVCENPIKSDGSSLRFGAADLSSLEVELSSLERRRLSVHKLTHELIAKSRSLQVDHVEFSQDLEEARKLLDTEAQEMVTPYLTQRDSLVREISAREQERVSLASDLKIRNQQEIIHKRAESLGKSLAEVLDKIDALKEKAPSVSEVLSVLSDYFNSYLGKVNIKRRTEIGINEKTFLPVVRGRDYSSITSGGLRTVSSIGYMLSILESSIDFDINHPRLLMIDTVGKYLGKTTKAEYIAETNLEEDAREGISDPEKYQNIYEAFLAVANRAEKEEAPCQIILVDNDVPESFIKMYKPYIVAHYSTTGENGLPLGLIDDIETSNQL